MKREQERRNSVYNKIFESIDIAEEHLEQSKKVEDSCSVT